MICSKCGIENPPNKKFCRECGGKIVLTCPQCGSENLPEDKFCGECGAGLIKPQTKPPIDYQQPHSYTPKHLADKILTTRSAIEGERKLVTVMFADVAGFTAMSEKLDPEDVHRIMDGCRRILVDEIHRCEGMVGEFRGDGHGLLVGQGSGCAGEAVTGRAARAARAAACKNQ